MIIRLIVDTSSLLAHLIATIVCESVSPLGNSSFFIHLSVCSSFCLSFSFSAFPFIITFFSTYSLFSSQSVCLSVRLYALLSTCRLVFLSTYLSVSTCFPICPSVCLSVCLSFCLSVYIFVLPTIIFFSLPISFRFLE